MQSVCIAGRLLLTLPSYLFYMHSFIHCVKGVFTHQHELASAIPHSWWEITEPSTLTICYASDGSGTVCMVDLIKYSKCTLQSSFCIYPISICSVSDIYVCVLEVKNSPPQLRRSSVAINMLQYSCVVGADHMLHFQHARGVSLIM